MNKPESIYMWGNVENTIQIIESWIDLINKKTIFMWYPILFHRKWILFTQIFSYYWQICANEKAHAFLYGFKYQCKSINEWFSKLEGFLHSRRENKSKTFPPIGNELLPPSKNITLTDYVSNETEGYLWLWY